MAALTKVLRVLLHGLALAAANFAGLIGGFALHGLVPALDQVIIQLPVAIAVSVGLFVIWILLLRALRFLRRLAPRDTGELLWAFFFALFGGPLIFIPLHYLLRGYLTGMGNIFALALFQIPANALAVMFARRLMERRAASEGAGGAPPVSSGEGS
jgi:hypothetical protein